MTVTSVISNDDSQVTTPDRFGYLLDRFRLRLEGDLHQWMTARRRQMEKKAPEALELVDTVVRLLEAGGKRLRPALVYHGFLACGGGSEDRVMAVASATELVHTYLLVHDDIMDRSELRRGCATAHVIFRKRHHENGWPGDSSRYGEAAAILVGDLAYTYATEQFTTALLQVSTSRQAELSSTFFSMCEEVIAGQHLEMDMALERRGNEEDVARVLRLKSGAYSVQRPLELGALLADANAHQKEVLSHYGEALGEAFQLQDDILGMFGETETVGKPVGGDLAEGKYTLLIHHACRLAAPHERAFVEQVLGNPAIETGQVERVRDIISSCGALSAVRTRIEERLEDARQALDSETFSEPGREFLDGLVNYLRDRKQ